MTSAPRWRILVLEGDLLSALTMKQMLDQGLDSFVLPASIDVRCCHSLLDAQSELNRHHYTMAIVDPELPDSHGHHTIEGLHLYRPDLPIVAINDSPDRRLAERCIRAGARDFLDKRSCTTSTLCDLVASIHAHIHNPRFQGEEQTA